LPRRPDSGDPAISTVHAAESRIHRAPTIVDYVNIRWVDEWCKRCNICVEICPKDSLILTHDAIIEATDCIRCGLCERYCPDLAIAVLPKRDESGNLPAEFVAEAGTSEDHGHVPEAARGPAIAGTDPHRGFPDTETGTADADQISRDSEG
jgi:2-oxoglutarate ferredoxin oxidoreductase subunit delta